MAKSAEVVVDRKWMTVQFEFKALQLWWHAEEEPKEYIANNVNASCLLLFEFSPHSAPAEKWECLYQKAQVRPTLM